MGKQWNPKTKGCRTGRRYGPRIRLRRRLEYIVAVQCTAWLAAVTMLLWVGPEWWDALVAYLEAGWRIAFFGLDGLPRF